MQDFIIVLINLFVLAFVLTSMFGTGLSLTIGQILDPLKDWKLVLLALVANFVLVPALAYVIALALNLDEGLRAGLIILAACAGAPFLPKLATIAKGNLAFSVGLMTLLMVVTVGYAPIALPLLIPGVEVSPWDIARPLVTIMLIPMGVGLAIKAWRPDAADSLAPLHEPGVHRQPAAYGGARVAGRIPRPDGRVRHGRVPGRRHSHRRRARHRHAAQHGRRPPTAPSWAWARASATSPPRCLSPPPTSPTRK